MIRFLPLTLIVIALGLFAVLLTQPKEKTSAKIGQVVSSVTLPTYAGNTASLLTGQPAIINVFATWCVPCMAEMPLLATLKAEGFSIIGVAYKDKAQALDAFFDKHGNPYETVLLDDQGQAALALAVTGVPETFVIDAEGKVLWHISGALDESDLADMRKALGR